MKNITLTILTIISISASGQSLIGIKGGLSFTNVSASNFIENNDSRSGFSGGISFEYFLKDNHSISLDLVFSQRGFTHDLVYRDNQGNLTGQKSTAEFYYDYVSLPIKTGFYLGQKISAFGNVGVAPSILVNAKTKMPPYEAGGVDPGLGGTIDVTEQVSKFDFAGLIEIGANYKPVNKVWLFSSITYQYSFTTITNSDYFADSKVRHNGLTLSFGVKYKLSKA